jgi:glycosyltransferase involved in cell wall biosynthesis
MEPMNLSIIVPAYKEPYLAETVKSILDNAQTEIEVFAVLDGYEPEEEVKPDLRLTIIRLKDNVGMRGAFNIALEKATGDFLMKVDAHCAFAPGFDKTMTSDCKPNWLMVPRRYSLTEDIWDRNLTRPTRDYHYLSNPETANSYTYGYAHQISEWFYENDKEIDDTMIFQGSCWMANREYFLKNIGKLDDNPKTYGSFAQEPQELCLKYWLGGGRVVVNKKTWYAHLQKLNHHYHADLFNRKYKISRSTMRNHEWSTRHWMNNEEPNMIHPFSWLIEKFWPVPGWPKDWQEVWDKHKEVK